MPAKIAALSGAWNGGGDSGLVVYQVDAKVARVFVYFGQRGNALPWHEWAKAVIVPGEAPRLEWRNEGASFSFQLAPDGKALEGSIAEKMPGGKLRQSHVVMARTPVKGIRADQVPPPFASSSIRRLQTTLKQAKEPSEQVSLVDAFVAGAAKAGTPLIEAGAKPGLSCATFIFRGQAEELALSGVMNGFSHCKDLMQRLEGTDLFYFCAEYPSDARIEYLLVKDGQEVLDPLNPRTAEFGRGKNSEAWMADYRPPAELAPVPAEARGSVEEVFIESKKPDSSRNVHIYLPQGYRSSPERYPVLYMNDAKGAMSFGSIVSILDHLIQRRVIRPLIVVLVPFSGSRMVEYGMNPGFEAFIAGELVPEMDRRYRTLASPENRAVGGISASATAALSLALHHPGVFGKCMAQSTASKLVPLMELAKKGPAKHLKVYLDVGSFEADFNGIDLLWASRRLQDLLAAHGCETRLVEVHEGHGWKNWRARTGTGLAFLFGPPEAK